MARVLFILFLLALAIMAVALISALSAEQGEVRHLPRPLWVLLILLVPLLGPALYLWLGRPRPDHPEPLPGTARGTRPIAPDDDPNFLARLRSIPPTPDPTPPPGPAGSRNETPPDAAGSPDRSGEESRTTDDRPPADA